MATEIPSPPDGEVAQLRQRLVDKLRAHGALVSPAVEVAFRVVPRYPFLPVSPLDQVYSDQAITTKWIDGVAVSSSSQPAIMAACWNSSVWRPDRRY